ncbi:MAG: hypothetical protein HY867_12860 [Chloroflexi bacterium]|nr:hypothetical protein [Chloroflexota bacterium]
MIKITSFYPFAGWLRVTQEFYEDKFIVKSKSLTFEQETEFSYDQVAEISDAYQSTSSQMTFGFWIVLMVSVAFLVACNPICANIALLRSVQIIYMCGVLLFLTGYIKGWYILLIDNDGSILTTIKQTSRNHESISQITELIKNKSNKVEEISVTAPFPNEKPVFEYIYYDASNLTKTTDRFYEKEMVGFEKGIFYERAYTIKYSELGGKQIKGAKGINFFGGFFTIFAFVFFSAAGLYRAFNILPRFIFDHTYYAFLALLALTFLLQFVKRETIGLYSKNEKLKYWAYVNRGEKEKVNKIVDFIQSRVPAENKEASPKETQ